MTNANDRIKALSLYLDCPVADISEENDDTFTVGREEYRVMTDDEASEAARDYIEDSLWAFNASFLIEHTDLPSEAELMVQAFQEAKCEDANNTIRALIKDMDAFVQAAIDADGRGHFLNSYDGEEHEVKTENGLFIVCRIN